MSSCWPFCREDDEDDEPKVVSGPWNHRMDSQVTHSKNTGIIWNNYVNPWESWLMPGLCGLLKWQKTVVCNGEGDHTNIPSDLAELDSVLPVKCPKGDEWQQVPPKGMRVTWLGHASVLVQFDGISVLTDPIFSSRASPFSFVGPKRYRDAPCNVEDLPKLDAVVISHAHYDHLDAKSVSDIHARFGNDVNWFVPKGLKKWFNDKGIKTVVHLDWWDEVPLPKHDDVKFVFTPTQHWSNRALHDRGWYLWGSWCVFTRNHSFFFGGDTGYCNGFKEIGERYGPFDLAAIPIGACEPRWFMKPQHVDQKEAIQIHQDLKCRKSVGVHWGTFVLTYEYFLEPKEKLVEEMQNKGLDPKDFFTLDHGEMVLLFSEEVSTQDIEV
ncbi:N-acyl-phosphatidylethanolamine-hydrolyzing phospholipase D-like [Anneissia japonica]|uniref:N-acyl-phosphatidylethanolamine-hydrolyzing phospholipase D-like n=1 Tax=Anneissia japonica TaxID=1529436 RepID=UPI0014257AAF|nr:N-acyl-phosphatidylethanolamine-hydrolyzing phospholipase D-like [Anneissia japonica]